MSTPIGLIFRDIQRAQRLSDYGFKEDLVTAGLMAAGELSRACDWIDLREEIEIVYSGTPVMLPGDTMGIVAVKDSEGNIVRRAENYTSGMDSEENFYALSKGDGPLASGVGLNIEKGASLITGVTLPAGSDHEWIEIADQPGCYEIFDASTGAIEGEYWGPKISGGRYTVRPRDTRFIEFGESGTYTVVLWHAERPLYEDHQRTVLPARAFQLGIIIHVLGFHEKQNKEAEQYRAEYRAVLSEAIARNPRYAPPAGAVVNGGYSLRFGRSF